jgi:DNA repair protein RAD50
MSGGLPRVRKEHVEEAIRQADDLAKSRDIANNNPRRTDIVKDIRVLEDKLKSISATIEQDTKIRNSLRLRFNEESEIKMLENQVNQEYEALADLVKDNSYLIGEHGENSKAPPKEDVLAPTEVLANNVRNKLIVAQNDLERQTSRVNDIQKKLSEKNGKSSDLARLSCTWYLIDNDFFTD